MATARTVICPHCGTQNLIATCEKCGRGFVLTEATEEGRQRQFNDGPVSRLPDGFSGLCDFDAAEDAGLAPAIIVGAGGRQRSCPNCHREFLSTFGFPIPR